MSCGSKTCSSTSFPNHLETAGLFAWGPASVSSWLSRVRRKLGVMLDKERRRQLRFDLEKARQRGLLKHLDDRMLRDLGLTREQATREANKPFWK
jgi:uncharacterized protein YjiS (DUF1127 family)